VKKDLLVFFGQYRTFDIVLPYLKNLDKVDVIVSTWSNELTKEKIDLIYKYIPHVNLLINNFDELEPRFKKDHGPMYFHWKNIINYLDETKYEKVLLHRTDIISNWNNILDIKLEEKTLYLNNSNNQPKISKDIVPKKGVIDRYWIDDQLIIGDVNIIKKLIETIIDSNNFEPHFPIGNVIINEKILVKSWNDFIKISSKILRSDENKEIDKMHEIKIDERV
jgi:hypothetical protein